jgi:excisionase family DNA binding protein
MQEHVTQQAQRSSDLLSQEEAAVFLRLRPDTLATWRCTKAHKIPFVKCGRRVFYRLSDLTAWLESRVIDPLTREED